MYLMYVDESGDPGNTNGSSQHYILSGFIFHYSTWSSKLQLLKKFRKYIHSKYGLPPLVEIHAKELIRIKKIKAYNKIKKIDRISILREYSIFLSKSFSDCKIINICFDKARFQSVDNFQALAWKRLVTRYDSYLKRTAKDEGLIIADESNENDLRLLIRKMRVYNPTPSHFGSSYNAKVTRVIEDIVHRKSQISYFIQSVDVITFLLYNKEYPKGSLKKYNIDKLFDNLIALTFKPASTSDPNGIVRK